MLRKAFTGSKSAARNAPIVPDQSDTAPVVVDPSKLQIDIAFCGGIVVVNKQEMFMNSGRFDVSIIRHDDEKKSERIYCRSRPNEYGWATKKGERKQIRDDIVKVLNEME
eukprot:scaffold83265_cov40-Attheya_sp.AAC.1